MKPMHVTYSTKPEYTHENTRLIRAVFEELRIKAPSGLRYMVLRHGEGRFVHIVEQNEGGPSLSDLQAFRAFQKDAGERIQGRPSANEVEVVGTYGFEFDMAQNRT
jgi:hypothetical protein